MFQIKGRKRVIYMFVFFAAVIFLIPMEASGEVKPITDLEDKLENISEEEKVVLEELFAIEQELDTTRQEETRIKGDIKDLQIRIDGLALEIEAKQADYDKQLDILKQVLVGYQRGGPASGLEILLNAKNLSSFIKSLNLMKDISHNVNELLTYLEEGKKVLQENKDKLCEDQAALTQKENELLINLHTMQELQEEQESYLASLQEDKTYYQEQLDGVALMWESCKKLFPDISKELTNIIGAGYFTLDDLNLKYNFFNISGSISEDTFNRILSENSKQPRTIFYYEDGYVKIEVPDEHLVLTGNFVITDDTAIQFEASEGTFYDMLLEPGSFDELFLSGPLRIDFKTLADNMITIDFRIKEVESIESSLRFVILPQF